MTFSLLDDPCLPQLRQLLDPACLSQTFAEHLRQTYPSQGLTLEKCQITKVDYRPAERLRLLCRLWVRDRQNTPHENWFFINAYPADVAQAKYDRACAKRFEPMDTFWQPVSFLPTANAVVWAFPYDSRLPHLRHVLDMEQMTERVRATADLLGLPTAVSSTLTPATIQRRLVKYKPAGRCVLRFDIGDVSFYSKTYRGSESGSVFALLQNIAAQGLNGRLDIPTPLCHHDDIHTLWQATWNGRSLSQLYQNKRWAATIPYIATALAALHQTAHIPHLPYINHLQLVMDEASEDAIWLQQFLPSHAAHVHHIVQRLLPIGQTIAATQTIPTVPIHGAFRMSQLLQQGDRLAIVDFDTAAYGDPLYDVAEFVTSLLFQYFRRQIRIGQLRRKGDEFCTLYAAQSPWPLDPQRLNWYIAIFLFEKLFGAVKGLRVQILPKLESYFALIEYFLRKAASPNKG